MTKVLTNIAFAKVSTNAFEARRYGYLRDTDTIIFDTAQRVEVSSNVRNMKQKQTIFRILDINISL